MKRNRILHGLASAAVLIGAAFVLSSLLTSCAWFEARDNRAKLDKIRVGMTKDQVKEIMGEPVKDEQYARPDIWFYYTKPMWYDGLVTRDECTPFIFDEGDCLEGWGYDYYKRTTVFSDWDKKPIDGSDYYE